METASLLLVVYRAYYSKPGRLQP